MSEGPRRESQDRCLELNHRRSFTHQEKQVVVATGMCLFPIIRLSGPVQVEHAAISMADSFSGAGAAFVTAPLHPREVLGLRTLISENIYVFPRARCPIAILGWAGIPFMNVPIKYFPH